MKRLPKFLALLAATALVTAAAADASYAAQHKTSGSGGSNLKSVGKDILKNDVKIGHQGAKTVLDAESALDGGGTDALKDDVKGIGKTLKSMGHDAKALGGAVKHALTKKGKR